MKEKILVAGGTGFIGHHVLKKMPLKKYSLYSLSKNIPIKEKRIKSVKYLSCDITKIKSLQKIASINFDHIINLSGYINHAKKKENIYCHFHGSRNLIDIFKLKNIKTFIQIGSSLEYGNQYSPQKEENNCTPIGWYGISKLKVSKYLEKVKQTFNIPYIILRPYQVYGPEQKKNRLIPQTIDSCLNNKTFNCTSGIQKRDFIYIDDFVDLIKKILKKENIRCEVFNVGIGKPVTVRHVIKKIRSIIKSGKPQFGSLDMRKDETKDLYPSIKKVSRSFNWKPKINLDNGLKRTIKYHV